MESILHELQLQCHIRTFQQQNLTPDLVKNLSDDQLNHLGIMLLGDKIRLREVCKQRASEGVGIGGLTAGTSSQQPTRSNIDAEVRQLFSPCAERQCRQMRHKTKQATPWTANFVCLSTTTQCVLPSWSDTQKLIASGLGPKKIRLYMNDSELDVANKIKSNALDEDNEFLGYPQLVQCGGFEFLCTVQGTKRLEVIKGESSARNLKLSLSSPRGKIFIHPIQKNLNICNTGTVKRRESVLIEICKFCNDAIFVKDLREHLKIVHNSKISIPELFDKLTSDEE